MSFYNTMIWPHTKTTLNLHSCFLTENMIKETVQYPEILNIMCFVDFRQETSFSVSMCAVRCSFADKLLKFPSLISGLLLYSEKIQESNSDEK